MPAFNLSKKIGANLDKVESVLKRTGLTYELIPVDDGSSDGTSEVLRSWASGGDANVRRPVILEKNVGKGGALKAGFHVSKGELVLLLDGDLEILPGYLPVFLEKMETEPYYFVDEIPLEK